MPPRRRWDPYYRSPFLARELRLATHRGMLGPDPACDRCGETSLPALSRRKQVVLCYECLSEEDGRSRVEQDHPLGRGDRWVHYTRPIPGNLHRRISSPDLNAKEAWAGYSPSPGEQLRRILGR